MDSAFRSARSLVHLDSGEISREIFVSADLYEREKGQLFGRAWLYVGHESQVQNVGDYFVSRMGEESVIVTRDRERRVRVFLNTCRHRGMRVCRYDEGNTKTFYCPYHGWTYGLDGKLVSVQAYDASYLPPFDKSEWGLVEVAQTANVSGTLWATWDKEAPPFADYMGDAYETLDAGMRAWDGSDAGTELLGSPQKWIVPSNWKFVAENFSGDMLHTVSHRSVELVGIGPGAGKGRRDNPGKRVLSAFPGGHGFLYGLQAHDAPREDYAASPVVAEYYREQWAKRVANMGKLAGVGAILGTVFPNMSFHAQQPRTILVAHPSGPNETEMWRVYFVDKTAPAEVRDYLRRYYMRYSGPGGLTEQDDMENWSYASASSRGRVARLHNYNYKSGLRTGRVNPTVPGIAVEQPITSEQNPRMLYKRWAEFMDAPGWSALKDPELVSV